jgi:hypothetical protein
MSAGTLKQAAICLSADVSKVPEVHGRNEDSRITSYQKRSRVIKLKRGERTLFTTRLAAGVPAACAGRHKVARSCVPLYFVRIRPIEAARLTAEE